MLYHSVSELVGNTPLIELANIERELGLHARLLAKLESKNPGGSAKDRIAKHMLDTAERSGRLKPGGTVIEPTSGNTGVGLAWVGTSKGYKVILKMIVDFQQTMMLVDGWDEMSDDRYATINADVLEDKEEQ